VNYLVVLPVGERAFVLFAGSKLADNAKTRGEGTKDWFNVGFVFVMPPCSICSS